MNQRTVSPRCSDDGGSVLVEAAIVFPLLAVLMSGLMEFGIAWNNRNNIEAALRTAVRTAAQLGTDKDADKRTLLALDANLGKLKSSTVNKVIIYKSTTANGLVPTNCSSLSTNSSSGNGITGSCNVYSQAQMDNAAFTTQFSGSCSTGWDHWWCPSSRKNKLTDPPDYLGLWISVKYTTLTKLFPGTNNLTITDWVVARLEPAAA